MRAGRRILIVDDDGALRQSLTEQLELNEEFVCIECGTAARRHRRRSESYAQSS